MVQETLEAVVEKENANAIRAKYPAPTPDFDYSAIDPRTEKSYLYSWPLTVMRVLEILSTSNGDYCFLREVYKRYVKLADKKITDALNKTCNPINSCSRCYLVQAVLNDPDATDRTFVQQECFERLKYIESQRRGTDIGQKEAEKIWFCDGFYSRFREAYRPDKSIQQIFDESISIDSEKGKETTAKRDPKLVAMFSQ